MISIEANLGEEIRAEILALSEVHGLELDCVAQAEFKAEDHELSHLDAVSRSTYTVRPGAR